MKVTFNASYYHYLSAFASNEEARYYLKGCNIRRHPKGGIVLTTTDGHRLGCFYDAFGTIKDGDEVTLSYSKDLIAKTKPSKSDLCFNWQDGKATIFENEEDVAEIVLPCPAIDHQYPQWARTFPQHNDAINHIGFNAKYLAAFGFAKGSLDIQFGRHNAEPAVIRNSKFLDVFQGLLMPVAVLEKPALCDFLAPFIEEVRTA